MNILKKIMTLFVSAFVVFGMTAVTVFGADTKDSGKGGHASITITLPTEEEAPTTDVKYTVYKVFDATSDGESSAIAYKIDAANGDLTTAMTSAGFSVDAAGNVSGPASLDANAIAAIAAYAKDKIGTYTASVGAGTLTITGLEYGYYYITTTTGSVVTVDSTNPNAEVNDKNTIPVVDKKITGASSISDEGKKALAQVGTKVTYTGTITVGNGAQNYVYHDKMSNGLSFDSSSVVVKAGSTTLELGEDYTVNTSPTDGDTFDVEFEDASISELEAGSKITVEYKATVTSDALTTDPANNTAYISYGDGGKSTSKETVVYNAKFTVTKQDGEKKPLAGAGFVIINKDGKYYKLENGVVSWVDTEADATEYTSDDKGAVTAFTGLADGEYKLHEKTIPAGYNAAADSTFTIANGDYTQDNLEQSATVVNEEGTELPSTGGIGTTIFYAVGALLIAGSVVLFTRKRRQHI